MQLYRIVLGTLALILSYFLGQLQCQTKTSTQKLKEIQYARQREKNIIVQPHADKFELLELMRHSKF